MGETNNDASEEACEKLHQQPKNYRRLMVNQIFPPPTWCLKIQQLLPRLDYRKTTFKEKNERKEKKSSNHLKRALLDALATDLVKF